MKETASPVYIAVVLALTEMESCKYVVSVSDGNINIAIVLLLCFVVFLMKGI